MKTCPHCRRPLHRAGADDVLFALADGGRLWPRYAPCPCAGATKAVAYSAKLMTTYAKKRVQVPKPCPLSTAEKKLLARIERSLRRHEFRLASMSR